MLFAYIIFIMLMKNELFKILNLKYQFHSELIPFMSTVNFSCMDQVNNIVIHNVKHKTTK